MSDWKYTFDPISKAAWLKQIEEDLQPKSIDSIQSEWWPGEVMFPAHHFDEVPDSISLPPDLFELPPRIMEWIDTTDHDARTINRKILNALQYGVQSIILRVDPDKKMPFRLWLDGVFSDMIELSIRPLIETPETIHSIKEIVPRSTLIRLMRNVQSQSSSVFFESLQGMIDENADSFRFIYEFPSSGNWTMKSAGVFDLIISDLSYWTSQGYHQSDFLDNCVLHFTPDTQFVKQIIQSRVLHLVWNNLLRAYTSGEEFSSSPYLECHIENDASVNPDAFIIHSSVSALAASLSGTHALCLHHTHAKEIPAFYDRIYRNIHHILNMESGIYKGIDPLAGSYAIDYYTRKWTEDIWEKLKKS